MMDVDTEQQREGRHHDDATTYAHQRTEESGGHRNKGHHDREENGSHDSQPISPAPPRKTTAAVLAGIEGLGSGILLQLRIVSGFPLV